MKRHLTLQNFISRCLESKEIGITALNNDGEKLISDQHPGKAVIEVRSERQHLTPMMLQWRSHPLVDLNVQTSD